MHDESSRCENKHIVGNWEFTRRKSEDQKTDDGQKILGEGCGGLGGGKCLESGTKSVEVWKIRQNSNIRKRINETQLERERER